MYLDFTRKKVGRRRVAARESEPTEKSRKRLPLWFINLHLVLSRPSRLDRSGLPVEYYKSLDYHALEPFRTPERVGVEFEGLSPPGKNSVFFESTGRLLVSLVLVSRLVRVVVSK